MHYFCFIKSYNNLFIYCGGCFKHSDCSDSRNQGKSTEKIKRPPKVKVFKKMDKHFCKQACLMMW